MYNDEETILNNNQANNNIDDESTVLDQDIQDEAQDSDKAAADKSRRNERLRDIAINGGVGFAVGTLASVLMSMSQEDKKDDPEHEQQQTVETPDTPVTTDGTLPVAHSVNDSMSFGQAFRAAHDEVGPGGVFEWHGQLYNTYTREEWNSLSHAERQEFAAHLKVVGTPDYESNVEHHHSHHHDNHHDTASHTQQNQHQQEQEQHQQEQHQQEQHQQEQHQQQVAQHQEQHQEQTTHVVQGHTEETQTQTVEVISHEEPVVEVLGVEHITTDDGSEVAVGGMLIDGHAAIVIDVDNNGTGDIMGLDANDNGDFEENEITDISSQNIAMSNFEIDSTGSDGSEIDYLA